MHRERLTQQAELLDANPEWAGVGCHVRGFPRSRMGPGDRAYERWINGIRTPADVARELFVECPVVHPTWVFRSEILRGHGYRDCGWPEDYDLLLRMITAGARVGVLPRRRLAWRHGGRRLSRESAAYRPDRFTRCKAFYLARTFLSHGDRYVLWGYGATGRRLFRHLSELGKRPSHIVEIHPGRLGNQIHGVPVVGIDSVSLLPRSPLIVSVTGEGPRAEIRASLIRIGRVETVDFVCAA
jgi:hypothetical protein